MTFLELMLSILTMYSLQSHTFPAPQHSLGYPRCLSRLFGGHVPLDTHNDDDQHELHKRYEKYREISVMDKVYFYTTKNLANAVFTRFQMVRQTGLESFT